MKKFITSNIENAAQQLELRANVAREQAACCRTKSGQRDLLVEARTWTQAAEFLRTVEIIPPIARK